MAKIIIDEEKCIGCGACTAVWDNLQVEETDQGFKAFAKKSDLDEKEIPLAKEAAEICPVDAINVKE